MFLDRTEREDAKSDLRSALNDAIPTTGHNDPYQDSEALADAIEAYIDRRLSMVRLLPAPAPGQED